MSCDHRSATSLADVVWSTWSCDTALSNHIVHHAVLLFYLFIYSFQSVMSIIDLAPPTCRLVCNVPVSFEPIKRLRNWAIPLDTNELQLPNSELPYICAIFFALTIFLHHLLFTVLYTLTTNFILIKLHFNIFRLYYIHFLPHHYYGPEGCWSVSLFNKLGVCI